MWKCCPLLWDRDGGGVGAPVGRHRRCSSGMEEFNFDNCFTAHRFDRSFSLPWECRWSWGF